eukprot:11648230-Heterocapsa_arctica.AAC.1
MTTLTKTASSLCRPHAGRLQLAGRPRPLRHGRGAGRRRVLRALHRHRPRQDLAHPRGARLEVVPR